MTPITFTCPGCWRVQALYPNIMSPGPDLSVYVVCPEPDCHEVAVHHPHPKLADDLRTWAAVSAEVDVQLFRRQLDRKGSA